MRFASLQRLGRTVLCPGRPAPNHPASAFAARASHPRVAWRGGSSCGLRASRRPGSPVSLRCAAARAGHSPDDFFTPVCRTRPGWLRPCRTSWLFSPGVAPGIWVPSQVFSGCPGCDDVSTTARPHAVFAADQSRALAFGFVSRDHDPPAGGIVGSDGVRLLGFGPVNQPYHVRRRPRYSLEKGRSTVQADPAMGLVSSCRSSGAVSAVPRGCGVYPARPRNPVTRV